MPPRWSRAVQLGARHPVEGRPRRIANWASSSKTSFPDASTRWKACWIEGELTTLALFDKPDPLDGPYFEETLYVTPSRLPRGVQDRIRQEVARACRAAGLATGPIHAEVRVNDRGIWMLEVAARSIGGLCGRVLTHSLGMSLEELILRQAVGQPLPDRAARTARRAS